MHLLEHLDLFGKIRRNIREDQYKDLRSQYKSTYKVTLLDYKVVDHMKANLLMRCLAGPWYSKRALGQAMGLLNKVEMLPAVYLQVTEYYLGREITALWDGPDFIEHTILEAPCENSVEA